MKAVDFIGTVDRDDEILPRLALRLRRRPLADTLEPVRHGQDLQLALLHPAQIRGGMEDCAELVGVALIQAIEIMLHHGFDA